MSDHGIKPRLLPHHRQVVIGPEPLRRRPDWRVIELDAETSVSHCPGLRAGQARDRDGTRWALLGLAVETAPGSPDPLVAIERSRSGQVPGLRASWAGRWLLVGDGRVLLDAAGLIGCFHGRDRAGRTWASSSPALLREIQDPDSRPATSSHLPVDMYVGIAWYPPPRARTSAMRHLLPSQVLDLRSGEPLPSPPLPAIRTDRGYRETLDSLASGLVESVRRLPDDAPLTVSLSAGLDSRITLAAVEKAGRPYELFTRISTRMSPADRVIPPQLAKALGHPLHVLRRSRRAGRARSAERLPVVMEHCDGHVSAGDAHPLLEGTRDELNGIMLGGWGWGIGKAAMRDGLPGDLGDPASGARAIAELHRESSPGTTEGLRQWLEWTERTPQEGLDWRDRFHLEQRMAGWQSAKEQVYDLLDLERIPLINSGRLYALLLEAAEGVRRSKQLQRDLVESLCPPLARFPANPSPRELGWHRAIAAKLRTDPAGLARAGAGLVAERARRVARRRGSG